MPDKDRKETETTKNDPASEKKEQNLTEDDMSKISGGISVDIGSLGVPVFGDEPNGN